MQVLLLLYCGREQKEDEATMKKAVIFDLYETLITEWVSDKYYSTKCADELGINHTLFRSIWENSHRQMNIGESTYRRVLENICLAAGVKPEQTVLDLCERKRIESKNQCFTLREDGIIKMLSKIKSMGQKIALCSNCSADEVSGFSSSDFAGYFDTVIFSYEVGMEKPEETIYQLCCEKLGVMPSDCLYIGDGGSRELYGAQAVGMEPLRAMWFLNKYVKDIKPMPFQSVDKTEQVVEVLQSGQRKK